MSQARSQLSGNRQSRNMHKLGLMPPLLLLHSLALGDVPTHRLNFDESPLLVEYPPVRPLIPPETAVRADYAMLAAADRSRPANALNSLSNRLPVLFTDRVEETGSHRLLV